MITRSTSKVSPAHTFHNCNSFFQSQVSLRRLNDSTNTCFYPGIFSTSHPWIATLPNITPSQSSISRVLACLTCSRVLAVSTAKQHVPAIHLQTRYQPPQTQQCPSLTMITHCKRRLYLPTGYSMRLGGLLWLYLMHTCLCLLPQIASAGRDPQAWE